MLRSAVHWATLSLALGALLSAACGETSDDDGGAGASGDAGTNATGGGAGKGGTSSGSGGQSAGKGGTSTTGGAGSGGTSSNGSAGTSSNGGAGTGGTSSNGGGSGGASGSGAGESGSGGAAGMNDCDPRKITCRRAAPVCDEGEAPSVEGICYGPCVPIATCACSSADDCPLPDMFTCHLSRGRCDYYVR